ncbi:hypothetical protein B7463_g12574, partial [Scytalidium lignicola]
MAQNQREILGAYLCSFLLTTLSLPALVSGVPWKEPEQTSRFLLPNEPNVQIPRPTSMPSIPHELLIRQQEPLFSTVCGYILLLPAEQVTVATNLLSLQQVAACHTTYPLPLPRLIHAIFGLHAMIILHLNKNFANIDSSTPTPITTITTDSSSIPSSSPSTETTTTTFSLTPEPSTTATPVTFSSVPSQAPETDNFEGIETKHLGTIAATVVGGIAALVLIIGLVMFFWLRKKR